MESTYIKEKFKELNQLMDKDKKDYITVDVAAKFLGMDKEAFRNLACSGNIPFAIGGVSASSKYTKVPKISFYAFCVQHLPNMKYYS